jgi:outer membrane lipoprotein-sorting protein
LVASEGASSFLGTDLSNDDIASMNRKTDLDNHRLLREDTLSGRVCYVIESTPRDSSYQYSKMILWVDKENYVNHRVELYDRRGTQVKLLEIVELREIQGRLTPVETRMTTIAAGTSTTIYSDIVRYNDNIPESVFTTEYLETGRAR